MIGEWYWEMVLVPFQGFQDKTKGNIKLSLTPFDKKIGDAASRLMAKGVYIKYLPEVVYSLNSQLSTFMLKFNLVLFVFTIPCIYCKA